MIVIGAGNAVGSLFGHVLVVRWGMARSLAVGLTTMVVGYAAVAVTSTPVTAVLVLSVVMLAGGFVFPVMMTSLQSGSGAAGGTVSSLANVAMYTGVTVGAAVAGTLFDATPQFSGVAVFSALMILIALAVFDRIRRIGRR